MSMISICGYFYASHTPEMRDVLSQG